MNADNNLLDLAHQTFDQYLNHTKYRFLQLLCVKNISIFMILT